MTDKLFFLALIFGGVLLGSPIMTFADNNTGAVKIGNQWFPVHTPTARELDDLKSTTHGIHDWLQRPDGTICENPASPSVIIMQKAWQAFKNKGLPLSPLDNPWPLLCSTNESQANDYFTHLNQGEQP
jgi:hypothetical protein